MIPINSLLEGGTLTIRTGSVVVMKEVVCEGVGWGTNELSKTLGLDPSLAMILGMTASFATSTGLNKIDTHFNISGLNPPKIDVPNGVEGGSGSSTVSKLTSTDVKAAIEKNGMSVDEFSKLLDPNKTLTPDELKIVDKVRADVGLPQTGTVMNKTIPQSDIYNYLYNENYSGVRGFVSVDEHSSTLKTLNDVFEGNRLDYNNTAFKTGSGVDGISQSVGNADTVYGKITYVLEDADGVKLPTDFPTTENAPYTGRGFTGSKNIVLPELVQDNRKFITGDILSIYDSTTGNNVSKFIYDKKLGKWILSE